MNASRLVPVVHIWLCLVVACAVREPCTTQLSSAPPARPARPEAEGRRPIQVALTIDDLPGTAETTPDYPRTRVMANVIAALKAHRVTTAVGFINGIAAAEDDGQVALSAWLEAGYAVGNHTYSHRSANSLSPEEFLADVAQNQGFIESQGPVPTPRFFRFPYLERGRTEAERITITRSLAQQGYQIANISIDFADWAFVHAYTRCLQRADRAALGGLSQGYLENARAALFWSVENAQHIFGRPIPHVLLLHAHAPTAENLDALLSMYEREGVVWIPLAEALRDPAYAEPPGQDHGDTPVLAEAARQRRMELQSSVPRSIPLLGLICR